MLPSLTNKYNKKEVKNMVFLYLFALIFLSSERLLENLMQDKNNWLANTFNKGLLHIPSIHIEKITSKRGKGGFLQSVCSAQNSTSSDSTSSDNMKHCVCTMWSLMHFLFYILLGYFSPSLFYMTLCIGIVFEIVEYFTFDCHDILDIVYNSSGFAIGYLLHIIF